MLNTIDKVIMKKHHTNYHVLRRQIKDESLADRWAQDRGFYNMDSMLRHPELQGCMNILNFMDSHWHLMTAYEKRILEKSWHRVRYLRHSYFPYHGNKISSLYNRIKKRQSIIGVNPAVLNDIRVSSLG